MSDNVFSENMVVCAVGILSPGNISDSCEICPHNKSSFPGVLIAGVTKDAVMMLSEKVELVPEGTKERLEKLEASNAELLEALEDCVIGVEGYFRLIAAAPELLAALEAAREFIIDGMAMGFVGMPEDEDVLDVTEKAIRKAKGINQ